MRRLLAILGATAMVVTAVVVRNALDDGDGGSSRSGDDEVVLLCDPDLRPACDAAAAAGARIIVRDSAAVAADLTAGGSEESPRIDGWITTAAWLEVVRSRVDDPPDQAIVLARSPVVAAVDEARAGALSGHCGDDAVWRCLGDDAGTPWTDLGGDTRWGPLRSGLPDVDTAVGLTVAASVAAGYFGSTDFAANDFTELRAWLRGLTSASGTGDRNLLTTLVRVRGTYSAGGLVTAQANGRPELVALPTRPTVVAEAVLVDLPGGDDLPAAGPMRDALVAAGWEAGDGDPVELFKPGVMAALHTLWKDTTS